MKKNQFFKRAEEFDILCDGTATVISVLNLGRTGPTPSAIHASKKGYRITVEGLTIAKGKTPRELQESFERAVAKAKAEAAEK